MGVTDVTVDYSPIHHAVSVLANACDYAGTWDGQGFNKADTWLGHAAADIPVSDWDDNMALAFRAMIRKYRKQLENHGIAWDDLPVPPGATDLDGLPQEYRDAARARINGIRANRRLKAQSWVRCDGEGERCCVAFPYNPAMVAELKAWPRSWGRHYNRPGDSRNTFPDKTNDFPFTTLPHVVEFADRHGIDVPPEVRALVPAAQEAAQNGAPAPVGNDRPNVFLDGDGRLCIAADYDPALNEAVKECNLGRSCWSKERQLHEVPLRRPARLREVIERFELTVSDGAREAIENEATRQEFNLTVSSAATIDVPMPEFPGMAPDRSLKDVQWVPVWWALQFKRVILGDEMGFGKTLQALAAVAAADAFPAVVVCRPSLVDTWCDEIANFFPWWNVFKAEGQTAQVIPGDADVIVIGSNNLGYTPPVPTWETKDATAVREDSREIVDAGRARRAVTYLLTQPAFDTPAKIVDVVAGPLTTYRSGKTLSWVTLAALGAARAALLLAALGRMGQVTADTVTAIGDGAQGLVQRRVDAVLTKLAIAASRRHDAVKRFGWVEAVNRVNPVALIVDEGQDVKEITANRTQAVGLVAAQIREADGYILNLSGTSILNYVRELGAQLEMMGLIHLFGGIKKFLWRYCVDPEEKAKYHEYGPSYNGRDNLEELFEVLRCEGIMVRRTDPKILGLLEFDVETIELTEADLDPAAMASYWQADANVAAFLAERAYRLAQEMGKDPQSAAVEAALKAESAKHLVLINTLRTEIGKAKQPYAMEWIRQQVVAGEKVVVAADRREEVSAYAKAFGGLKIQGGQTAGTRHADKKKFQNDPDAMVISIAIKAGGTGHTLHANGGCNRLLEVELMWGPGDEDQLGKRIHRIGQTRPCTMYRLVARMGDDGTPLIDDYLDTMVASKRATLGAVLDGDFSGLYTQAPSKIEASVVGEVAWAYAKRGMVGDRA